MAAFGIRAFKRLKEDSSQKEEKRKFYSHIVVGGNAQAVRKYLDLVAQHGTENVGFITEVPVDRASLQHQWRCSMHTIRNEDVAWDLMGKAPRLELIPVQSETLFYKDTKLHPFGGRAKPFELREGEELFQPPYYKANWQNLFTAEEWENLEQLLKDQLHKFLDVIEVTGPAEDLVERTHYKLHTGEFECFECENLYWFLSPKKFINLVKDKSLIADEIMEYGTSLQEKPALVVYFESQGQVYEGEGTLFLPQSMTHEWGHFIFDFDKFDVSTNTQAFRGLMLLQEEELSSEEELAKKIKLMKRVLERVFPVFAKMKYTEHIRFDETMFILGGNKSFEHVEFHHTL